MDLTIEDVAEMFDVTPTKVNDWLKEGKIPSYQLKKQHRFSPIEIENWVLKNSANKESEHTPLGTKKGSQQYSFYRALHKGEVFKDVEGKTKEEVIGNVVRKIAPQLSLDPETLTKLLLDREQLMPTALNYGLAVPHTREITFNQPYDVVVIAFLKEPIEYGALDGQPVDTLFFLFASEDKRHLHLLAKIAHLSSRPDVIDFLATKPAKAALLDFVKSWESLIHS